MIRVYEGSINRNRLNIAAQFLTSHLGTGITILGAQRHAIEDFVLQTLANRPASFGIHQYSLSQLVARLSAGALATAGLAPSTSLGEEAIAARAAHESFEKEQLGRLKDVVGFPGFPRATLSTVSDLRQAMISTSVSSKDMECQEILQLLANFESSLQEFQVADRAASIQLAMESMQQEGIPDFLQGPLLLLDLPIHTALEAEFVAHLCRHAKKVLATVPAGDHKTHEHLKAIEGVQYSVEPADDMPSSLDSLRQYLFSTEVPPRKQHDDNVQFFSAPGESRECIEIARLCLEAAKKGERFDDIAIFLRAPEAYTTHLDAAFRRAKIPAYFARGTKCPDPAGRAFLALLACSSESLSAKRFAEYLSFGQVPNPRSDGAPPRDRDFWIGPEDDSMGATSRLARDYRQTEEEVEWIQGDLFSAPTAPPATIPTAPDTLQRSQPTEVIEFFTPADTEIKDDETEPTIDGTLKAPWKWEELLVEAAVIGGKERWKRRLRGLEQELKLRLKEGSKDDQDSPRAQRLAREVVHLGHLERFAFPVIEFLDSFPTQANWGEWVSRLCELAPMVLRNPERVLGVLAELRPMSEVGPVGISEVLEVLKRRLSLLEMDPPSSRYGRVFVGTPDQARARAFKRVFIPGLAERTFPRRLHEDPLLLDHVRHELSPDLHSQEDRGRQERLLLRLGVGAAIEKLILSYPRIDSVEAKPRVPSFYGLDIVRATQGVIPKFEEFERQAAELVKARLAWPAPDDPQMAIDSVEHDLAVLGPLLYNPDADRVRGRAHYLLQLNDTLARSLRSRYLRWGKKWAPQDGLIRSIPQIRDALAEQRLTERAYSVTALQRFAVCPYQFYLSAILRLEPREEAVALIKLDPMTRGSIFHHIQSATLRGLQQQELLPLPSGALRQAEIVLDSVLTLLTEKYNEMLAPAIPRVWQDEVETMRADLRIWLRRMTEEPSNPKSDPALKTLTPWTPRYFEFAFGLPHDEHHDPKSLSEVLTLPGGWKLKGAIDLIEESTAMVSPFAGAFQSLASPQSGELHEMAVLRVTDHKTGANHTAAGMITGGGEVLQPVLYSLAVENLMQAKVAEGRLYFCTSKGAFTERIIPIDHQARQDGERVLEIINRSVVHGWLMPIPNAGACDWCNFRTVCGPHEEERARHKEPSSYRDLEELRKLT